jgi:hypothetical protein
VVCVGRHSMATLASQSAREICSRQVIVTTSKLQSR